MRCEGLPWYQSAVLQKAVAPEDFCNKIIALYIYALYIYIKCPIYNILGTYSSLRNISERKSYHPTESMALFNWQRFPLISAYNKDTSDSHRCHKVENTRKISFCKILGGQYFYWDNVTGCSPIIKSYTSLSTKT